MQPQAVSVKKWEMFGTITVKVDVPSVRRENAGGTSL